MIGRIFRVLAMVILQVTICSSVYADELSTAMTDYQGTANLLMGEFNYLGLHASSCPGPVGEEMSGLMPELIAGLKIQMETVKAIESDSGRINSMRILIADTRSRYDEMEQKLPTIRSGLADPSCQKTLAMFEKMRSNALLIRTRLQVILSKL